MNSSRTRSRLLRRRRLATLAFLAPLGLAHPVRAQGSRPARADTTAEEMEVPHGFFTHEGLPEGMGKFNLRTAGLVTRNDGSTKGDFAFHLETSLTKTIGLHIRNDRFLDSPRTEAMFQFAAITSKNGLSGFAPIIEFEFPTKSGAGRRIDALVGQTVKLANARVAFNEVVHYDPREDAVDWSASFVAVATPRVFPIVEILGEGASETQPIVNLLGGLKVRVREGVLFGVAYQFPLTKSKDFSSQLVAQPDVEWTTRRD